jgi:glycosyltransferase involved in cell wall biosynthesis
LDRYQRYIDAQRVADVAERVHLMGAFEPRRAPEVMARFDALLVPSQWNENAPLVVLQARAAGVPIVACDVPGVREVAPPTAVLVPREDAQGLAHALRARILAGPALRESSAPCTTHAAHVTEIERVYQTARLQRT